MVSLFVLGQNNKVPSALVNLVGLLSLPSSRTVHFTAEDGFEQPPFGFLKAVAQFFNGGCVRRFRLFQLGNLFVQPLYLVLYGAVLLVGVVEQLLDTHHVAVVGNGHAAHAVRNGFVHKFGYAGHSVQQRVLGMYVKMYKILHLGFFCYNVQGIKLRFFSHSVSILFRFFGKPLQNV